MPLSNITIGGNSVTVVSLPTAPGFRSVEFDINESVGTVKSIFTGQVQAQRWSGADYWSGTVTLPSLTQIQADAWIAALMQCGGMSNAFLIGDPAKAFPRGSGGSQTPTTDGSFTDAIASPTLHTQGWTPSTNGLLLPGDYIQIGYRLHRVLEQVNSDTNGKAVLTIWPTIREAPVASTTVILTHPQGLFRLRQNTTKWSTDYTRLTSLSFPILEHR